MDTGLIDPKSETFLGVVKYGCAVIGVCILVAAVFEFVTRKFKRAKVVPYSKFIILDKIRYSGLQKVHGSKLIWKKCLYTFFYVRNLSTHLA